MTLPAWYQAFCRRRGSEEWYPLGDPTQDLTVTFPDFEDADAHEFHVSATHAERPTNFDELYNFGMTSAIFRDIAESSRAVAPSAHPYLDFGGFELCQAA